MACGRPSNRAGVAGVEPRVRASWLAVGLVALAACGSRADTTASVARDAPTTTATTTTTSTAAPSSTTTPPTTTTTAPSSPPATATWTEAGIRLTLTVEHAELDVGSRVWADLLIEHVGDETVWWQAGGCGEPGTVTLVPGDAPASSSEPGGGWDGDPSTFRTVVREHNALRDIRFATAVGYPDPICPANSVMAAFQPGDELRLRAAADVRVPPGALASPDGHIARGAFRTYDSPDDYPSEEGSPSSRVHAVSVAVQLRDHAARTGDAGAIDAFADSRVLADFVARTRTSKVQNTWALELSWWRDQWELWVRPYFSDSAQQDLRLRYDPARGALTDARVVFDGRPPEDDPGASRSPGTRSDEVLAAE